MPPVVGIPRTLSYYTYYPFWKAFLEGIGCRVIISRPTNRSVLDAGVRDTVSDACVPIKLAHGHANDLKDKVDYIFCPRMVSGDGRSTFCPKFLGLPDMIRFSRTDLPPLIDTRFRIQRYRPSTYRFCRDIGRQLGAARTSIGRAFLRASAAHRRFRRLLTQGHLTGPAIAMATGQELGTPASPSPIRCQLAVMGFPYIINDKYITVNLLDNLAAMGAAPHTPDMVPGPRLAEMEKRLPLPYFWYYSNQVAASALHYMSRPEIDGMIHVTAFGCGPDSMLNRALELEAKNRRLPLITVTVDEHTGQAGIATRLEAFVDMLLACRPANRQHGDRRGEMRR